MYTTTVEQLPFADGEVHDLRVIKAVKRDAEGKPVALVGLSLDITEELRQANALRENALKLMAPGTCQAGTIFLTRRTTKLTIAPFGPPLVRPVLFRLRTCCPFTT